MTKRLALAVLFASAAARADHTIKLGTIAPVGSTWHNLLKEMGDAWATASGGKVKLKIYAGGVLGNEGAMVQKMQVGQLHAAAITAVGLHEITPEPQAVDVPMMIDTLDEYDYVQARVQDDLEKAVSAKGYVVMQWGEVGFARFFSTKPYASPAAMAEGKIFTWEGDPASERAWRAAGLNPVVLTSTDIVPALTTGMINIVTQPPLFIYTTRLFEKANQMLDLNWGYLTGATVVRRDAWEKIPAEVRTKLLDVSREYGKKVSADIRRMNDDALEKMKAAGLTVVAPANRGEWEAAAQKAWEIVRGKVVPVGIFDKVKKYRDEFRASKK